ncbi:MAG: hypothetical protein GWO07_16710 [Candidatus Dadabacteria bacterium]|nr:hypothetical protein [Candidatus Dadabacteria bacterium]NIS10341.1 hypothetical protein [Candidatus Dadabacteria bacterium]NIY23250.1 hypothetical protein [Candidatus Dadabacteria bacterium]
MARSSDEQFLHDWVIRKIKEKNRRIYSEVNINPGDEQNFDIEGKYPDVVLVNHGQVVGIIEVDTKETVEQSCIDKWKALSELGVKLTLVVPKEDQNKARDLVWKNGLVAKVDIKFFDVQLNI